MNLCRSCGRDFGSIGAFDKHRVGKHEYLFTAELPDGRRCLTDAELRDREFARNAHGRWTLLDSLERGRSLSARDSEAERGL